MTTYADSELQKLILGQEPLANLPQIYAKFKSLGLDQIMATKQQQFTAVMQPKGQ
jgi:hypothetical protein